MLSLAGGCGTESDSDDDTPNVRRFRHEFEFGNYTTVSQRMRKIRCSMTLFQTLVPRIHMLFCMWNFMHEWMVLGVSVVKV